MMKENCITKNYLSKRKPKFLVSNGCHHLLFLIKWVFVSLLAFFLLASF